MTPPGSASSPDPGEDAAQATRPASGQDSGVLRWRTFVGLGSAALVTKLAGAALAFATNVLIARLLGADLAGLYFLSLAIAAIAAVTSRMGLDSVVVRFGAAAVAGERWGELRSIARQSYAVVIGAGAVAALGLALLAPFLADSVFGQPPLTQVLRLISIAVLPLALLILAAQWFKALKKSVVPVALQSALVPGCALVLLLVAGVEGDLPRTVILYVTATVTAATAATVWWWMTMPGTGSPPARFPRERLVHSGRPLYAAALMNLLITWLPVLVLGVYGTASEVAIFSVAVRTANLESFVLVAINTIVVPRFAELAARRDFRGIQRLVRRSMALAAAGAALPLAVFVIGARPVMNVFGEEFAAGASMLLVLAVGHFVNVVSGPVGQVLVMLGRERTLRTVRLAALGLVAVLCAGLVPRFAGMGAAVAAAVTLAASNVAAMVLAQHALRQAALDGADR